MRGVITIEITYLKSQSIIYSSHTISKIPNISTLKKNQKSQKTYFLYNRYMQALNVLLSVKCEFIRTAGIQYEPEDGLLRSCI